MAGKTLLAWAAIAVGDVGLRVSEEGLGEQADTIDGLLENLCGLDHKILLIVIETPDIFLRLPSSLSINSLCFLDLKLMFILLLIKFLNPLHNLLLIRTLRDRIMAKNFLDELFKQRFLKFLFLVP